MGRVEKLIEIRAPPEKVWEMLALDRFQEWQEGSLPTKGMEFTSEVRTPEDKYRVGASAHITSKRAEMDVEIMESLENEKFSSRSTNAPLTPFLIITYTLNPTETGTEMTYAVDYEMPWGDSR